MCLAVLLELGRFVTLVPIKNKHSVWTFGSSSSMPIEVLKPFKACLIICPAIVCWFNYPVVWKAAVGVPVCKMILPLNHQKRRNTPAFTIDTGNSCCPLSIAWLNCFASATSIGTCNNHCWANHTYHKACFVKVVKIAIQNTIFCPHILY